MPIVVVGDGPEGLAASPVSGYAVRMVVAQDHPRAREPPSNNRDFFPAIDSTLTLLSARFVTNARFPARLIVRCHRSS
jgi:hypothetical protein